jgi:hypothetical protein
MKFLILSISIILILIINQTSAKTLIVSGDSWSDTGNIKQLSNGVKVFFK